jgi:hypothetical protein
VARDTPSRRPLRPPLPAQAQASLDALVGTCVAAPAPPRGSGPSPVRVVIAPSLDPGAYGIPCSTRTVSPVRLPPDENAYHSGRNAAELACSSSWPGWHRPGPFSPPAKPTKRAATRCPEPLPRPAPASPGNHRHRGPATLHSSPGTTDNPQSQSPATGHHHQPLSQGTSDSEAERGRIGQRGIHPRRVYRHTNRVRGV